MRSKAESQAEELFIQTEQGLFSVPKLEDLKKAISKGVVAWSSWVYWLGEWIPLLSVEELRECFEEVKSPPKAAPDSKKAKPLEEMQIDAPIKKASKKTSVLESVSDQAIWFVVKNKKKFGPYSALDVVKQLQSKEIDPKSYIWKPGFSTWQQVSSVTEFSKSQLRDLAERTESLDILVKRKHVRAPYVVDVIAHDNNRAFEGRSMVIGEGGLFLSTTKPMHGVGSRLKLHFREGGAPSFNAVAEVVSVVKGELSGYCLRFISLSDSDRKKISKLVSDIK